MAGDIHIFQSTEIFCKRKTSMTATPRVCVATGQLAIDNKPYKSIWWFIFPHAFALYEHHRIAQCYIIILKLALTGISITSNQILLDLYFYRVLIALFDIAQTQSAESNLRIIICECWKKWANIGHFFTNNSLCVKQLSGKSKNTFTNQKQNFFINVHIFWNKIVTITCENGFRTCPSSVLFNNCNKFNNHIISLL